jgi:hypothetical protein
MPPAMQLVPSKSLKIKRQAVRVSLLTTSFCETLCRCNGQWFNESQVFLKGWKRFARKNDLDVRRRHLLFKYQNEGFKRSCSDWTPQCGVQL